MTPAALLSEVTPAPIHPFTYTHTVPWPSRMQRGAHLPPLEASASAATLPSSREPHLSLLTREEREKAEICVPRLLTALREAAQPFQAEAGVSREEYLPESQPRRPQ